MRDIAEDMRYDFPALSNFPIQFISIKNNFIGEALRIVLDIEKKRKMKISHQI